MGPIATEVRNALTQLGISAEELNPSRLRSIRDGVQARFVSLDGSGPLWERIKEDVSIQDPEAWRWLGTIPLGGRAVLFFEESEEPSGFMFDSAADVVSVLAESTGFEFYLTDEAMSFLAAFNHHDYLSATGAAAQWLLALKRSAPPRA